MAVIKGRSTFRQPVADAESVPTQQQVQRVAQEQPDIAPTMPMFDPTRRGGLKGRGAAAGKPKTLSEARSLDEMASIINEDIETTPVTTPEAIEAANVQQIQDTTDAPTPETPEPVAPVEAPEIEEVTLTPTERKKAIQEGLQERVDAINTEAISAAAKQREIASLTAKANKEIQDIAFEQKLEQEERAKLGEDFRQDILEEKIDAVRDISQKEGISMRAAEVRFEARQQQLAKLDPEDQKIFGVISEIATTPGFNKDDLFGVAIAEYEKDGIDEDDMKKAHDAVASIYGSDAADFQQDEFLINVRGLDRDIVEGNRELFDTKKLGQSIVAGKATDSATTKSYLDKLVSLGRTDLVSTAVGNILSSDKASQDSKNMALDFLVDIQDAGALTKEEFAAGKGTAEQRERFRTGFREFAALEREGQPLTEATFIAGQGTPEQRAGFLRNTKLLLEAKQPEKILTEERFRAGLGTPEERKAFEENTKKLVGLKEKAGGTAPNFDQAKFEFSVDKEYKDQSKEFQDVQNAYQRVQQSGKSKTAAGDLALIFNYMKMLDPNSVVRESEFRSAEQAKAWLVNSEKLGIPIPAFIKTAIQKADPEKSGAFLLPQQRDDFIARARDLFIPQINNQVRRKDQFQEQMTLFGGRKEIIQDLIAPEFSEFIAPVEESITEEKSDALTTAASEEELSLAEDTLSNIEGLQTTGNITKKYEGNITSHNPDRDIKGNVFTSHGTYQLNRDMAKKFAQQLQFSDTDPESEAFAAEWDRRAQNPIFAQQEKAFMDREFFDVQANKLRGAGYPDGFINHPKLQELIFDVSVNSGANTSLIINALKDFHVTPDNLDEVIDRITQARGKSIQGHPDEAGLKNRFSGVAADVKNIG